MVNLHSINGVNRSIRTMFVSYGEAVNFIDITELFRIYVKDTIYQSNLILTDNPTINNFRAIEINNTDNVNNEKIN